MSPFRHIIIFADSLTNDFVSPLHRFQNDNVNIGRNEIDRLLGAGAGYGYGPLPRFLGKAFEQNRQGRPIHPVFIRDVHDPSDPAQMAELLRFGPHNLKGGKGCEFAVPFGKMAAETTVLDTASLSMPITVFRECLLELTGNDPAAMTAAERAEIAFVMTGVHTNVRVLHMAATLRNDYEFPHVYVCPHLVASRDHQAHLHALQVDLPNVLVEVVPGLEEMYALCGLEADMENTGPYGPVKIEPGEIVEKLQADQVRIIQALFLFYSGLKLKPLGGGYSGGLLFLAQGEKKQALTAPEIIKIDRHMPMHREIQGYNQVRALLGKQVPAFAPPVSRGEWTGVRMELAAMSGGPQTLQALFEKAGDEKSLRVFLQRFEYLLQGLGEKLYRNTRTVKWIYPYREYELQNQRQRTWLKENIRHILPDQDLDAAQWNLCPDVLLANCINAFAKVTAHVDRLAAEFCLCHGDLNFANMLSDELGNVWVIDWAYAGYRPLEYDFAKMENDIKFVMSKQFSEADLARLNQLESCLLRERILPEPAALPPELAFVRTDFRFQLLYAALQCLRRVLHQTSSAGTEILYTIALLKFAAHTLSFDRRRGRGECDPPQLKYALLSLNLLTDKLLSDDFHQKTNREKPQNYPDRLVIMREKAAWHVELPDYHPPGFTAEEVLANDRTSKPGAWADPADPHLVAGLRERPSLGGRMIMASGGRPLNPAGRTGLHGRGVLGKWGPNPAVDPLVTRINPWNGDLECLLVKRRDTREWSLPGTLLLDSENPVQGAGRAVRMKTGLGLDFSKARDLGWMQVDDFRNTDNAWIETTGLHYHLDADESRNLAPETGATVADADWVPLSIEVCKGLFANHVEMVKRALLRLAEEATEPGQPDWIKDLLRQI